MAVPARRRLWRTAFGLLSALATAGTWADAGAIALEPCRLKGVPHEAQCGRIARPLDPDAPAGVSIDVHFAILPALARNKHPDPVVFFAGGPGQSAIALAGPISAQLARFSNRRDLIFIDQRGTGRSAPLACDERSDAKRPLAEQLAPAAQLARLAACRQRLMQLPHGDLRHYTTTHAMRDVEAVRQALGLTQLNLVGASYGTRAALEYLRLHPQSVRRIVLDGAAPPDMVLPLSFSTDNQAALESLFDACTRDAVCRAAFPQLSSTWRSLLQSLPRDAVLVHPLLGHEERVTITTEVLLGLVRGALYLPALGAALPQAIADAAAGHFGPLLGLASALNRSGAEPAIYSGMHFSVVCAEDEPRRARSSDAPGVDFGATYGQLYAQACAQWPRGHVDPAFYELSRAQVPTLVLSGAADPATPQRHGARVVAALGASARHVVVPHGGHGVMGLPCLRDAVFKFVDAASDEAALAVELRCAERVPRPPAFVPPGRAKEAAR